MPPGKERPPAALPVAPRTRQGADRDGQRGAAHMSVTKCRSPPFKRRLRRRGRFPFQQLAPRPEQPRKCAADRVEQEARRDRPGTITSRTTWPITAESPDEPAK